MSDDKSQKLIHQQATLKLSTLVTVVLVSAILSFGLAQVVVNLIQQQAVANVFAARVAASALIAERDRQHNDILSQLTEQEDIQRVTLVGGSPVPFARVEALAASNNADTLIIINGEGDAALRLDAIRTPDLVTVSTYQSMSGENYSDWGIVRSALAADPLLNDQTYSAIMDAPSGPTLMTSMPIITKDDTNRLQVSGTAVIGSSLERLLLSAREDSGLELVFITPEDQLITSTANNWQEINSGLLAQGIYEDVGTANIFDTGSPTYLLNRQYYVTFEELSLQGNIVGSIGAIQPTQLPIERGNPNITAAAIVAITVLVAVTGLFVRQRMLLPLGQLISISKEVSPETAKTGSELRALVTTFQKTVEELQQANSTLEEENAKSKAILESIGDGVVVLNTDGDVILENPSAHHMLKQLGSQRHDIFFDVSQSNEATAKAHVGEHIVRIFRTTINTNGVSNVFVLRDITDEEFATKTKNNFLNQIGHELRTPLTSLMSYADILRTQSQRLPDDIRQQATDTIFEQGETLGAIINHLIEVTGLETDLQAINRQPTDLRSIISSVLTEINRSPQIELDLHLSAAPVIVSVDMVQILRAVRAIIMNAIHYSPKNGVVSITVDTRNTQAVLTVRDEAMGISETDLPHIFERFYRGTPLDEQGNLIDVRGTGVGLYVAKTIVEAHNGHIEAESAVGRGSTFTILLPLVKP